MPLLALAMLVGCWLHLRQAGLWPQAAYGAMVLAASASLAGLAWLRLQFPAGATRLRGTRAVLTACAAAELVFGLAGWRAVPRLQERLAPALWGASRQVLGVVQGLPSRDAAGARFEFAPLPGQPGLPPRLQVSWSAAAGRAPPRLRAGQAWSLPLRLRPAQGLANPGGADAELRWLRQGVGGLASLRHARDAEPARRRPELDRASPWQRLQALREGLRARLERALAGHPRAGTLAALALGDQSAIGEQEWQLYRSTGVAHLMAISGLHVTLQAWLAGALAGALWRRLRWRGLPLPLWLAAPWPVGAARALAALAYAALAGLGVPAQRALLMLAVALGLRLCARRLAWSQVLAAALCAVLLWDPWAVAQPGAWLSFGAVAALLLAEPRAAARPQEQAGPRWRRAWQRLRAAARAQWAVSLALAPLSLAFFQQVSLVAPLANALAIPAVTLGVLPLAVGGFVLPPPLDALAWRLAAALQDAVLVPLGRMASWPLAQWQGAAPAAPALALALPAVLALVLPWPWRLRLPGLAALVLLLLAPAPRPPSGHLQAWMADVGQGSAIVLRTRRHTLVFDTGPPLGRGRDAGSAVLLPLLRQLGERQLDLVVLSHADADHIGGAGSLARAYPGTAAAGSVAPERLRALGFGSASRCLAGRAWTWDGVRFEWLHPGPGSLLREDNAGSCVLRAASAYGSVLLAGDLERPQELALLRQPRESGPRAELRADLLVAGHHGSRGSSSEAFLRAVAPRAVAVQAGLLNRYGHPHPEFLARLRAQGLCPGRTDLQGALLWDDRQSSRLLGWRAQPPRYWRSRAESCTASQQESPIFP
ncbi:MAG: DNA internalization-related competence protein ComEC/Rec2 [Betaproteobacteria bacterium]|nr:DNA internalization-related competence protein ComEC/Rec2 [Betaproteobacteria bacterium]